MKRDTATAPAFAGAQHHRGQVSPPQDERHLLHFNFRHHTLSALFALLLAACSAPAPLVTGPAHPPMWLASDGDTRFILIGSVHQLPPDLNWQDARVARAVGQADELLLELDPVELPQIPALFARVARDEPVASLDTRIGRDLAEPALDVAASAGIDEQAAQTLESWGLAMALGSVQSADAGLLSEAGVESTLTRLFQAAHKPIHGLERAADQLALFDALPPATQDAMLARTVRERGQARADIRDLLTAWARGDVARLARLASEDVARTPGLAEPLVYARNRAWAAALTQRAQRPGTVMVAVGTGHLVGAQSLPTLLRAAGFQVRAIR
ncbi:MAG: TraB/GumN family protein [Pseudomonadota bacterium]|mgnify:CR=1 FL=1